MFEAAIAGAVTGFAIAIPVGVIAVLIIHTGLTRGLRVGMAAAAGAATADGIYSTIAVIVGIGVTAIIGPWIPPLRIVGGLVLIALGVRGLLSLRSPRADGESSEAVIEAAAPGHRRTYLELLGLTLLNPATIVYFAAVTVGLPAHVLDGVPERIAFAVAAFAASLSWQIGLAVFGAVLGRGLGHRIHGPTVILGNAIVIALGVLILLDGLKPPAA